MNQESGSIKSFTDLHTWQEGHRLVLDIYRITRSFPVSEAYGLTSQMRRAAVSITSNIAEGFGRQSYKEKVQFYYIAQASLTELQNQLMIARDIDYITTTIFFPVSEQATRTHKLLTGLVKGARSFKLPTS